jgi:hypothetical protein
MAAVRAAQAPARVSNDPVGSAYRYALIVVLGVAMGIQNATARKLAVPDLTTTVLTLTITGVAADSAIAGGSGSAAGRRLVAVAAMFAGALAGAALALDVHIVAPLASTGCDGGSRAGQRASRCGRTGMGAPQLETRGCRALPY